MKVGVISDTHGYLDRRILDLFAGVEAILHAGDIGSTRVLEELERVAPVTAVRGNTDRGTIWEQYPPVRSVYLNGAGILLAHKESDALGEILRREGSEDEKGLSVLVYGHSHSPELATRHGMLCFNPGSGGRATRHEPTTVGILTIDNDGVRGSFLVVT